MRTPSLRIVVPLVAAIVGLGIAHAQAEEPPPADAARLNERYAIAPGTESLIGDMLGKGETLAGCTLSDGKIERTVVLATYTCGDGQVVLQLLHPASAPSGGVRTDRFAIGVQSGTPPGGLLEAVAARVRAREGAFTWTELGDHATKSIDWRLAAVAAAGVVAAVLVFVALRRRRAAA